MGLLKAALVLFCPAPYIVVDDRQQMEGDSAVTEKQPGDTIRHTLGKLWRWCNPRRFWDTLYYYVSGLCRRVDEHHIFLQASGLAFALITCIIPLVLILLAFLGVILERPSIVSQIDAFIDRAIPYSEYAAYIKGIVNSRVGEFTAFKTPAGLIGLVGLLFASTGLFSSMRTVLNVSFSLKKDELFLLGKVRDLGLILLVAIFVLLSTTLLPSVDVLKGLADKVPLLRSFEGTYLWNLVFEIASFILVFLIFFVLYFAVPHGILPRMVVLISSFSAAVLWYAAKELFGFYIIHFVTLRRIYGAYSLLIVVAFWVYYTAIVFILGAEIGQLYRERKAQLQANGVPPS